VAAGRGCKFSIADTVEWLSLLVDCDVSFVSCFVFFCDEAVRMRIYRGGNLYELEMGRWRAVK
jgi:hypothetical protein